MNFLGLRSNQTAASEQQATQEIQVETNPASKLATSLEGLIAEDPFPETMSTETMSTETQNGNSENDSFAGSSMNVNSHVDGNHLDVTEDEGWIAIPYEKLPDNWSEASDMRAFRSLDRSFVFPGEQAHILACLSACKQDTEVITPFKVAAVMNKNGMGKSSKKQNGNINSTNSSVLVTSAGGGSSGQEIDQDSPNKGNTDSAKGVTAGESLLRMEDHRRQTESLLQRFSNSHFFVRIAESNEPLWSKKRAPEAAPESSDVVERFNTNGPENGKAPEKNAAISAIVDRGKFDSSITGGVARNAIKCCSLANGDIVVFLQINVSVDLLKDPVLEILQFEKYQENGLAPENRDNLVSVDQDPCRELLRWLLPLDNSITPPARPLSPPQLSSSANIRSTSIKPNPTGSSGSQIFSFSNFRSYSMSSLPPNSTPSPPVTVTATSSRSSFDLDDGDQFSFRKNVKSDNSLTEGLLSFRGVPLEPERFSVHCGLEGIYIPGRKWRRKIEIIQPVEIHSTAANCNTDDLLCVEIKNICPAHTPDIVVYIDAITIVYEEASKAGPPLCFPIACIEAGDDYSLPNLELRRGEEHSFILKPATSQWKSSNSSIEKGSRSSNLAAGNPASAWRHSSFSEGKHGGSPADQYTVLVSCRCNYTESRLFFKKPTSWRPRISRDLMISVASEMYRHTVEWDERVTQLPIQVLTLQVSNLTSEDLTLTVLAPASFTSPPSVLSLSSQPSSPMSPTRNTSELTAGVSANRQHNASQRISSLSIDKGEGGEGGFHSVSLIEQCIPITDVLPSCDSGCTHIWLQSRVQLGSLPSQSTATIKLEVLPLTEGIITLDSLQIDIKEKGVTYVPEQSLKINATSSLATGII